MTTLPDQTSYLRRLSTENNVRIIPKAQGRKSFLSSKKLFPAGVKGIKNRKPLGKPTPKILPVIYALETPGGYGEILNSFNLKETEILFWGNEESIITFVETYAKQLSQYFITSFPFFCGTDRLVAQVYGQSFNGLSLKIVSVERADFLAVSEEFGGYVFVFPQALG